MGNGGAGGSDGGGVDRPDALLDPSLLSARRVNIPVSTLAARAATADCASVDGSAELVSVLATPAPSGVVAAADMLSSSAARRALAEAHGSRAFTSY